MLRIAEKLRNTKGNDGKSKGTIDICIVVVIYAGYDDNISFVQRTEVLFAFVDIE